MKKSKLLLLLILANLVFPHIAEAQSTGNGGTTVEFPNGGPTIEPDGPIEEPRIDFPTSPTQTIPESSTLIGLLSFGSLSLIAKCNRKPD